MLNIFKEKFFKVFYQTELQTVIFMLSNKPLFHVNDCEKWQIRSQNIRRIEKMCYDIGNEQTTFKSKDLR